MSVFMLSC